MRKSDSSQKAFTLIELMIVVSIIGLIMAAGVPGLFRAMQKQGLRKAVSDIMEAAGHARAQAILRGAPMELSIRAGDGLVSVHPPSRTETDEAAALQATTPMDNAFDSGGPRPAAAPFSAHIPADVAIKFLYVNFKDQMDLLESRVRFFPNGTSDEMTLILFSEEGEQKISIDVVTGLANLEILR
jgi:prepilin-type N-terminal cleavage/methylation domain-containing protein